MKPQNDREAVSLIIDGLIERGCILTHIVNGEGEDFVFNHDEIDGTIDELMSCDDGGLGVTLPDETDTWVYFVYGNDPEEVVAGNGVSLSEFIDPIVAPWWN